MKLEIARDTYPLDDFGEMVMLAVDTGVQTMVGYYIQLYQISATEWVKLRGDRSRAPECGVPSRFAIFGDGGTVLHLYPAPDKDYELIGRYYPALRRL